MLFGGIALIVLGVVIAFCNLSPGYSSIPGVLISLGVTLICQQVYKNIDGKHARARSVSILYYDLLSIESYLEHQKNDETYLNIRFSHDWQTMVAHCKSLNKAEIKLLYNIYDLVYNYNVIFGGINRDQYLRGDTIHTQRVYGQPGESFQAAYGFLEPHKEQIFKDLLSIFFTEENEYQMLKKKLEKII